MKTINHNECLSAMLPIRDALEVISGKWRLLIITSISAGNNHFRKIQQSIPKISSKVLAKELKSLEEHKLIKRGVDEHSAAITIYELLPHATTLKEVLVALRNWGQNHRHQIIGK